MNEHHFISYSRSHDSEFVEKLRDELQRGEPRFRVWIDQSDMQMGIWTKQIEVAIDTCRSFLLVVSEESTKSEYVEKELLRAQTDKKPIIPLLRDSKVKMPYLAGGLQYVDFSPDRDFDKGLAQLRKFLKDPEPLAPVHQPPPTNPAVINSPPLVAPAYFQGRDEQYRIMEEFLSDDAKALFWISGRAGSGKTALACRVLERVRRGHWADPNRSVAIEAIAYVGQEHHSRSHWLKLFAELRRLLAAKRREEIRKQRRWRDKNAFTLEIQNFLTGLADRRIVLLVDHVDDLIDLQTRNLTDPDLRNVLKAVLSITTHRLKVIVTSRVLPIDLPRAQQGRWHSLNLGEGLSQSEAIQLLKALDQDANVGLRDGNELLLAEICRRTQGNPLALEEVHRTLVMNPAIYPATILRDDKAFLLSNVLDILIGQSYACLDRHSKLLMQVLSVSESPVTVEAVAWIFRHYLPDIDPEQVLSRLVNMQLVRKIHDCFLLREADRRYVASQLTDGASSAKGSTDDIHLDRFTLYQQYAGYFREIGFSDELRADAPQLHAFRFLCGAGDFEAAARILGELETRLFALGRYQELAQYYEQLAGKLHDIDLERHRLDTLARIYHRLGNLARAIAYYEEGLKCVRDACNRSGECHYLASLAICKQESGDLVGTALYSMASLELAQQTGDSAQEAHIWSILGDSLASLGQIPAAIQAGERALKLARDTFQREIEVVARVNLGQYRAALGDIDHAQIECDRACRIAEAIGFQLGESAARRNLGTLKFDKHEYKKAATDLKEAMQLADVSQNVQLQQTARTELATALLLNDNLSEAEAIVGEAIRFDTPLFNPDAFSLRGVILHRQGKAREAADSFLQALKQAEVVLKRTSRLYRELDAMGLSYSGLMLSEQTDEYLDEAIGAYEAARLITNEPGIVRRMLCLFNALAQADSEKKLASIRKAIDPGN